MNEFSIVPYQGDSPFKPWPSLAGNAFCLNYPSGESIFYFDALAARSEGGPAAPVLVLIHGLGDEADTWRHLIPLLQNSGFRVLALDLPGFGRSVAHDKISLKNHAAAVIRLVEAAIQLNESGGQAANQVFLTGNSMGALIAEMAAFKRPDLFNGIILIDGSMPGGPVNPGPLAVAKILFSRKWYQAYRDAPSDLWASLYPYYADLDSLPQEDRDFLRERVMVRVQSPKQEQAFFATQSDLVRTYLFAPSRFSAKIKCYPGKILLVWGEKDRIIPLSSAQSFASLRGDIKLEVISGAGHLPQQEKPDELAGIILGALTCVNVR